MMIEFIASAIAAAVISETPIEAARRDFACPEEAQQAASERLAQMYAADQDERKNRQMSMENDLSRRVEVSALFANGCLRTADDFYHAAMIYQHGLTPEHYFQAYIWASRASELGHEMAAWLIPRAVDRYLMTIGRKQLYGTNFSPNSFYDGTGEMKFFCLWPVEPSFPDDLRAQFAEHISSTEELRERVLSMNDGQEQSFGYECPYEALPAPRGSVPGHW